MAFNHHLISRIKQRQAERPQGEKMWNSSKQREEEKKKPDASLTARHQCKAFRFLTVTWSRHITVHLMRTTAIHLPPSWFLHLQLTLCNCVKNGTYRWQPQINASFCRKWRRKGETFSTWCLSATPPCVHEFCWSQLGSRIMKANYHLCDLLLCFQVRSPSLPCTLVQLAFKSTRFSLGTQWAPVNYLCVLRHSSVFRLLPISFFPACTFNDVVSITYCDASMSEMPKWCEDEALGCTWVHNCTGWSKIILVFVHLKSNKDWKKRDACVMCFYLTYFLFCIKSLKIQCTHSWNFSHFPAVNFPFVSWDRDQQYFPINATVVESSQSAAMTPAVVVHSKKWLVWLWFSRLDKHLVHFDLKWNH